MAFVNFCLKNFLMRMMYHADNVTNEVIQCNKQDMSLLQFSASHRFKRRKVIKSLKLIYLDFFKNAFASVVHVGFFV